MTKVKLSDFPTTEHTPFLVLDDIKYTKYYSREKPITLVDENTGEYYKAEKQGKLMTGFHDSSKYSKLFTNGKLKLANLSSPGVKVFCYIMMNCSPNHEDICLHPQEIAKDMGYKDQRSVYEGLVDLLNVELIARKTGYQSCFWINPNLFFNGDRLKLLSKPERHGFVDDLIKTQGKEAKEYADGVREPEESYGLGNRDE